MVVKHALSSVNQAACLMITMYNSAVQSQNTVSLKIKILQQKQKTLHVQYLDMMYRTLKTRIVSLCFEVSSIF